MPITTFCFEKQVSVPRNIRASLRASKLTLEGPLGEVNMYTKLYDKNGVYSMKLCFRNKGQELHLRTCGFKGLPLLQALISLVNQYLEGLTKGFLLPLELVGVGIRAGFVNDRLELRLGYSHPVYPVLPGDVQVFVPQPNLIYLFGISKKRLAQVAAVLKAAKPVEPYKGKGILLRGSANLRKTGKKG